MVIAILCSSLETCMSFFGGKNSAALVSHDSMSIYDLQALTI